MKFTQMKPNRLSLIALLLTAVFVLGIMPAGLLAEGEAQGINGDQGLMIGKRVTDEKKPDRISNTKIAVISDPHYYDAVQLGASGAAFEAYLAFDRKLLVESAAILRETVDTLKASDVGIVLVVGDLTKDGELINHQRFAECIKELKDSGKKVYVINGNHDINNPHAVMFVGDSVMPVPTVTPEEFKEIYYNFGYGEAIAADPNSLSYVVEPVKGLWIIAMDSAIYDTNFVDGTPKVDGGFSEETFNWILEQTAKANKQGKLVLGMMHHGLIDHFTEQRQFFPEYIIDDADNIAVRLAEAGMSAVFTGHFHAQDIVSKQVGDKYIFDIQTGSLVSYPCPYRVVEMTADNKLQVTSARIASIAYARDFLVEGISGLTPYILAGILTDQGMPYEQAIQVANNTVKQEVVPGLPIRALMVELMISHYEGDETLDPQIAYILQGMTASDDPLLQMLGGVLLSLGTDLEPADNNVTLKLKKKAKRIPI